MKKLSNRGIIKNHSLNSNGAYSCALDSLDSRASFEEHFRRHNSPHYQSNSLVACPKCHSRLKLVRNKEQDDYYECVACASMMSFAEYQKRFININWTRQIKNGVVLYSWDGKCPNCGEINPFLSYCINENFGTEDLCRYAPILLGSVPKIDALIMKMCRAINKFPNSKGQLSARIFCSRCDAPIPYNSLLDSFLNEKVLDVEYVIKKEVLLTKLKLTPEDISKTMNYLVLLKVQGTN